MNKRDVRLLQEVDREVAGRRGATMGEIVRDVLARPLRRGFYVSVDTALEMDRRRRRGSSVGSGKKAQMWADMFAQIDRLMESDPSLSRLDAVSQVIASGTSQAGFCLSRESAMRILCKSYRLK